MRISDWSSDVCSSDLSSDSAALDAVFEVLVRAGRIAPMVKTLLIPESASNKPLMPQSHRDFYAYCNAIMEPWDGPAAICATDGRRSEEHTSELQSLMRSSYAVFCLKKKKVKNDNTTKKHVLSHTRQQP